MSEESSDESELTETLQPPSFKDQINNFLTVHKFCWCCSLRTGCLIIGYVNMVLCFVFITFIFIVLSMFDTDRTIISMFAIDIVILSLIFVLHVVLLFGIYEKRRKLITTCFRGMTALLLLFFIMDFIVIIFITTLHAKRLVHYLWSFFCLLVVGSYDIQLAKSEKEITYI